MLILAKEYSGARRWPELDGLCGGAILMVFLLHYVTDSRTHEGNFGLLYHFAQIFRLGWSGVDLFFVLSGFLIGGILLDARSSSNYFQTFYTRRIRRILPIYYVWIALYVCASYVIAKWNVLG
jgi:peptidoglycan/LPS O-acetylase OafA/YrhL